MTDQLKPASAGSAEPCLPPELRKNRLRADEASRYLLAAHGLRVAHASLNKWRSTGGGPSYNKAGASVLYPRDALDEWALARLGPLKASTSDGGA